MRKRKRIKIMPPEQFEEVRRRNWAPVKLEGDAIPSWLRGILGDVVDSIYASGTALPEMPFCDANIPSAQLIGGIDVYRKGQDDPYDLNKDWCAVITLAGSDGMLLVMGPVSDSEHWLDEIPDRLKGAEILAVPPKQQEGEQGEWGCRAMMPACPLAGADRGCGREQRWADRGGAGVVRGAG